jgi:hypothetical protein
LSISTHPQAYPHSVNRLSLNQHTLRLGIIMLYDALLAMLSCIDDYELDLCEASSVVSRRYDLRRLSIR